MPLFRPAKPKGSAGLLADVVLPAGQQAVPLNELLWSEGDIGWTPGTGFVVGRPGLYMAQCSLSRALLATASQMQVRILVNGLAPPGGFAIVTPSTTNILTSSFVELLPLLAGDTVQLAGTLSLTAAATARRIGTKLSLVRIGPERWT